jgi:AcrR family transcriptional regulator
MNQTSLETTVKPPTARRVPRGRERRDQLVAVAEHVFLERGFSESTMQMIATRAGASKETLYRHFANKEALFAEVVSRRAIQISGPESGFVSNGAPSVVLFNLGCNLLKAMSRGEAIALLRLAIAEMPRTPELGGILYAKGPGATQDRLTAYLREATGRGELRCLNPEQAAKLFLGAVTANYRVMSLINPMKTKVGDAEIADHVRTAVDMFLSYYG